MELHVASIQEWEIISATVLTLTQNVGVGAIVETQQQSLPYSHGGVRAGSRLGRGARRRLPWSLSRRGLCTFLPLAMITLLAASTSSRGILPAELLRGGNGFFRLDTLGVHELGRSFTARSAFAVIVPVDFFGIFSFVSREGCVGRGDRLRRLRCRGWLRRRPLTRLASASAKATADPPKLHAKAGCEPTSPPPPKLLAKAGREGGAGRGRG